MNYIKQLQAELEAEKAYSKALVEGLDSIHSYASLPKYMGFENEGINKTDILNRVMEVKNFARDTRYDKENELGV